MTPTVTIERPDAGRRKLLSLCEPGGDDLMLAAEAPLADAIDRFRAQDHLRMLALVDADARPIGAVLEQDIRAILYNPFGHSLLRNPAFSRSAASHRRDCPVAEADIGLGALLDLYARAGGAEGVILTEQGRFSGIISNRTLLRLAGARETEIAYARADRYERTADAGRSFLADVDALSSALDAVAGRIDAAADATAGRVARFQTQSTAIAAASEQTLASMGVLAEQGSRLAGTIQRLRRDTLSAQAESEKAVALSAAGGERAEALTQATHAIGETLAMVRKIAAQAHLLSVNAAIEAARLGRDGGGFGVVARELRQFAAHTRSAVEAIDARVDEIGTIAGDIAEGHKAVDGVIRLVGSVARSVDEAVGIEAESARLLAGNVDQARQASAGIRSAAAETARLTDDAGGHADALRATADRLGQDAGRLRARVDAFVREIGAS